MSASFSEEDNVFVDRVSHNVTPAWVTSDFPNTPLFIDTFLANRTAPRLRPDPSNPYQCFDVAVGRIVSKQNSFTPSQLLDVALLFPASLAKPLIRGHPDLNGILLELCAAAEDHISDIADAVDVLVCLSRAGAAAIVWKALGSGSVPAADLLRRWRVRLEAHGGGEIDFVARACEEIEILSRPTLSGRTTATSAPVAGSSTGEVLSSAEAAVRAMLPDASLDAVRSSLSAGGGNADAAVWMLLDSGNVPAAIGKRTGRRRLVLDVKKSSTFSGETGDKDGGYGWIKARMDAEMARLAAVDPDDPRNEKQRAAYSFLLDGVLEEVEVLDGEVIAGMYDDDVDEGALLYGEEPLEDEAGALAKSMYTGRPHGGDDGSSSDADDGGDAREKNMRGGDIQDGGARTNMSDTSRDGRGGSQIFGSAFRGGTQRGTAGSGVGVSGGGGVSGRGRARGNGGRTRAEIAVDSGFQSQSVEGVVRGRGRGRGVRDRGRGWRGRANHGRRDGALKKQSRTGM